MREDAALFEKAARSFAAAEMLLDGGDADFAVSRAYYGYFYVAEGLLLTKGLRFSRHGQVIAQYGQHFAATEILDRRFHRLIQRAFALRQRADYSTRPDIDSPAVRELIDEGFAFLSAARDYVSRLPTDDTERQ